MQSDEETAIAFETPKGDEMEGMWGHYMSTQNEYEYRNV